MKYKFPEKFWWGSATSGPQTEGSTNVDGKSPTVWDIWFEKEKYRFFEENFVKGDLYKRYDEYTEVAKKLNFNSLRTSIQWSRLIPDGKNVNEKAVEFYRNYFQSLIDKGIEPIMNLMHFDLPKWSQDKGGWVNKETIDEFVFYAKVAFEKFGDLVKTWFTFNEPIVPVEAGYFYDMHYPNEVNIKNGMQALWNSLLAHIKTVNMFKENKFDGEIGIILNITPAIPRSDNPADIEASKWAERFQSTCYLDPIMKGEFPQEIIDESKKRGFVWDTTKAEFDLIKNAEKIDILGVNYYSPQRVKAIDYEPNWNGAITPHSHYFNNYVMPGRRINPYRGWEIFPEAVYMMMKNLRENYGNVKMYVAENGMGVQDEKRYRGKNGKINDTYRIDFMEEHLSWIHKAIQEGSNCVGYHMWTYVDNWSWMNSYKNRYGFVELDIETGELKEKESANWIRKVIDQNGF